MDAYVMAQGGAFTDPTKFTKAYGALQLHYTSFISSLVPHHKMYESPFEDNQQKAGYNQSAIITDLLGHLLGSYIVHMNRNDLASSLEVVGRILDIISAKVKEEEIEEVDKMMKEITEELPEATKTHVNEGQLYLTNPYKQKELKIKMSLLFRRVNKLQDKYGYGMIDQADPRLAVLE